jgi:hypothetical protein
MSSSNIFNIDQETIKLGNSAEIDLEFLFRLREQEEKNRTEESEYKIQIIRRLYIRAVVTAIESGTWAIRQKTLLKSQNLSIDEICAIREVNFDLKDNGDLREKQAYAPLSSSIRFAFRIFAKSRGLSFVPDYSLDGWSCLQKTVQLRNRLTHPKNEEDLFVTDYEMSEADKAELWFRKCYVTITDENTTLLLSEIEKLKSKVIARQK